MNPKTTHKLIEMCENECAEVRQRWLSGDVSSPFSDFGICMDAIRALKLSIPDAPILQEVPAIHVAIEDSEAGAPYVKLCYAEPDFGGSRIKGRYVCYLVPAAPKEPQS